MPALPVPDSTDPDQEDSTNEQPEQQVSQPPVQKPDADHSDDEQLTDKDPAAEQEATSDSLVRGSADPNLENQADEPSDEDEVDGDGSGGRMSFLDHVDELRKRLVLAVTAIFVGFLFAFSIITHLVAFVMRPLNEILPAGGEFIYTEPTEAFFLYIKVAALVGLILAIPVVLYQLWLFVAPGLYVHEKKFTIPFVSLSSIFFVGGCLFSHYLLFPIAWLFLSSFSTDLMTFMPRIQPTFALYVRLMLACGVVFQMPTLVFFLARVGAVSARFLARNTKYAILIIFVLAAILTPTGDPATLTLMALPMVALYGLSICIAWLVAPKRRDDDA